MNVAILLGLIFMISMGILCIVIQLMQFKEEDLPLVDPSEDMPSVGTFFLLKTTHDVLRRDKQRAKHSTRKRGYQWNLVTQR